MGFFKNEKRNYLSLSLGKLRERCDEFTPNAERRETVNPRTGEKRIVFEKVFDGFRGRIFSLNIKDSDFGERLELGIADGPDRYFVDCGVNTVYGRNLLHYLPGVDFSRDVELKPYSFTNKEGATVTGVSLYQVDGQERTKVDNYFVRTTGEGAKRKYEFLHGYPVRPDQEVSKEKYDIYRLTVLGFIKQWFYDNTLPNFTTGKMDLHNDFDEPVDVEVSHNGNADDEHNDLPF